MLHWKQGESFALSLYIQFSGLGFFLVQEISLVYIKKKKKYYMPSIYEKKKKTEGESNGLSLLCKSGFGLLLS